MSVHFHYPSLWSLFSDWLLMTRRKPKMGKESLELSSVTPYLVEWAAMLCYTHTASQRALCGSREILNRAGWLQLPPVSYVVFNRGQEAELHMWWGSILPGSCAHTPFSVCLRNVCRFWSIGSDHSTLLSLTGEVCGIYSLTIHKGRHKRYKTDRWGNLSRTRSPAWCSLR